jgi:hypothetical protein
MKTATKAVQTINLGVKDSARILPIVSDQKCNKDLGNIIGTVGTMFVPTPASPYVLKLIAAIEKLINTLKEDLMILIIMITKTV